MNPILPLLLFGLLASVHAQAQESRCIGTTAQGRLIDGVSLPLSGSNFEAYSLAGWALGRTYVHSRVRKVLLAAFASLEKSMPETVFVYGETGWKSGGRFSPHRTHQNGLSVDLMVPVRLQGKPAVLPAGMFNRYGYDIEFDDAGVAGDYAIDFEALAELIYQIDRAAKADGIGIARVIFEVPLQRHLWASTRGPVLRERVSFSTRAAWVRHDEHIHIDFAIRCARGR